MDIVRELDAEIDRARSTLHSTEDQRGKFVEDVLRGTEWAIRLQLVRQVDSLTYQQLQALQEAYLGKLAALGEETWAMMGRDYAVLKFVLDEQVRIAQGAVCLAHKSEGAVPAWLRPALMLNVSTLIRGAEAAGALNDRAEAMRLNVDYAEQIAQALGVSATTEPRP